MREKNGITLVALVITIIVLLILAGVSIATLTGDNGILTMAKEAAKKSDLEAIKEDIKLQISSEITSNNGMNPTNVALKSILEKYGTVEYEADGVTIKGVVTTGGDEIILSYLETTIVDSEWNGTVNSPKLVTGMTGIYWDESGNEVTVTSDNQGNWYDYVNKRWANAKTADGSYWVWIPRYEYKIATPHTITPQTIDVKFMKDKNTTVDNGYTLHPGFTFGTTELTGMWVAKFKASGSISTISIKPNVNSLRGIVLNQIFQTCRNLESNNIYGWGTNGVGIDTHLMKNIEWGMCSYLSSSQYGKTGEVWINPNANYITGQAGQSADYGATVSEHPYNDSVYGVNASTTGNIYGIYDMSGLAWEAVSAYINNGNTSLNNNGASLINAESKYKDVYTTSEDSQDSNYNLLSTRKGDAMYETSSAYSPSYYSSPYSWYGDFSLIPTTSNPFFLRGGFYSNTSSSGLFAFGYGNGTADGNANRI